MDGGSGDMVEATQRTKPMSRAKPKHSFGSKVVFWAKFVRIEGEGRRKNWVNMPIQRTSGIFLGYRTLSNGVVQTESYGEPKIGRASCRERV